MTNWNRFKCDKCGSINTKTTWIPNPDDECPNTTNKWIKIVCKKCGHIIYYNGA